LSPDVDLVLAPAGWDVYLRAHEVGTHSAIGALVIAGCAAALVHRLTPGSRSAPLVAAASAGAMSHLTLDALSGARLRPAWPFALTNVSLPLVAMADPWLLAILVAGALVMWRRPSHVRPAARVLAAVVIGFLGVKGALLDRALRSATLEQTSPRAIEARWGSLTQWYLFDRTPRALRVRLLDGGGPARAVWSWPVDLESPRVSASRSLDTVNNFLHVHELGFALEESDGADRTGVFWSDIRYCWQPNPTERRIACGLWFGGIFGPDGRALTQQVKVGRWVRSRPPPR
jgi:membrane-bound metal-dependent hydrolase YbcI (DUF457 family)